MDASSESDALSQLPHGGAFRFVDEIMELDPGQSGKGRYRITGEEDFLRGHFPGNPIMPAVIMVEAVAQLGGVVAQSDPNVPKLAGLRLTAMRNVKVYGTAIPGEILDLRSVLTGRLGTLIQIEGQVSCGERQLVTAQVTLSGQADGGEGPRASG